MYTDCEYAWEVALKREVNWEALRVLLERVGMNAELCRIDFDRETKMLLTDERWKKPYTPGDNS